MISIRALFSEPKMVQDRQALLDRWSSEGLHDGTSLSDALENAARNDPDNTILFHSSENPGQINLAELSEESRLLATAFAARGIGRGDVVAVQLPNRVETLLVYTALARLGAIFVPIKAFEQPCWSCELSPGHASVAILVVLLEAFHGTLSKARLDGCQQQDECRRSRCYHCSAPSHVQ